MKKLGLFLISVCLLCGGCTISSNQEIDTTVDMTPRLIATSEVMDSAQIAETVKSAIVGISASLSNASSIGSGVAVADGGYIITNYHVINGAKAITLYFADKSTASANFVWGDSSVDIAILRSAKNLPYLDTSPLENVEVGDDVLAVGTPLSLQFQHTFTKGIVSALNRTIEIPSLGGYTTYMQNLIQHDASINSGNSGGPLINTQGKVIGINSLKASDAEGIGFAIPIETATAVANKIIKTGQFKQVYLGVFGQDATLAKFNQQTTEESGVFVVDIDPQSPLAKTNLQKGDVIVGINGKEIKNTLDLRKAIYALSPEEKIEIAFKGQSSQQVHNVIV